MRLFFFLALAATLPAGAQSVYRCGAAFSDKPCGPDQQVLVAPVPPAPKPGPLTRPQANPQGLRELDAMFPGSDTLVDPAVRTAAESACKARLTKEVTFLDPDSVRVTSVSRRGVLDVAGQPLRVYGMRVNAKNAYGGYTGEKDFLCLTQPADERVVVTVRRALWEH